MKTLVSSQPRFLHPEWPGELAAPQPGEVWLVGAGPGDPGLLTVRGLGLLRAADVVVHDRLGCEEILLALPGTIRRVDVGKLPGEGGASQDAINRILEQEARAGQRVVRLKGGDPFVFGRGMEEVLHLAACGIACHVLPGISSALAAPGAAGIPVTHRATARGFHVGTGRAEEGFIPPVQWQGDTQVFLMGVSALGVLVERLLAAGAPAELPAAVISRATTYRERRVRAPLAEIEAAVRSAGLEAPAVLVLGPTVAVMSSDESPREAILVTSSRVPPALLRCRPRARMVHAPLQRVEVGSPSQRRAVADALGALRAAAWILFPNPHAVTGLFAALHPLGLDARVLRGRLAAVGEEAAARLEAVALVPDLVLTDGAALQAGAGETVVALQGEEAPAPEPVEGTLRVGVYRLEALPAHPVDWTCLQGVFFASSRAVARFAAAYPKAPVDGLEALCQGRAAEQAARGAGFGRITPLDATNHPGGEPSAGMVG